MKIEIDRVIAYENVVDANSDDEAIEKASELFGNNIEISHETFIVESSKQ